MQMPEGWREFLSTVQSYDWDCRLSVSDVVRAMKSSAGVHIWLPNTSWIERWMLHYKMIYFQLKFMDNIPSSLLLGDFVNLDSI